MPSLLVVQVYRRGRQGTNCRVTGARPPAECQSGLPALARQVCCAALHRYHRRNTACRMPDRLASGVRGMIIGCTAKSYRRPTLKPAGVRQQAC